MMGVDNTLKKNVISCVRKPFELDYSKVIYPQLVYEIQRQGYKSLNEFANKHQIGISQITEVLTGKRTLTNKFKLRIAEILKLDSAILFNQIK